MIAAIETVYNGYRFRSRLEARWAVFFDTLGVRYEYEKEGYELEDGLRYLPDFWLPDWEAWAEVKPDALSVAETAKCQLLAQHTGHPCIALIGWPAHAAYRLYYGTGHGGADYDEEVNLDMSVYKGRLWCLYGGLITDYVVTERYETAVLAARQARFEWGERGAPRRA